MTSVMPSSTRRVGIAGTTLAHGALIALALFAARRSTGSRPASYEVRLVAAPAPSAGSRTAAITPPAPKPVAQPAKPKATAPAVKKPPAPVRKPEPAAAVKPQTVLAQGERPSTGHDAVTIQQEGLAFPFPDYLNNIVSMVYKRWNHSMFRPGLEAKITFVISKDGTVPVGSYVVEKSSGSPTFDEYARSAIESVDANHEFGPLPSGFTGVSLPIRFVFAQVRPGAQ